MIWPSIVILAILGLPALLGIGRAIAIWRRTFALAPYVESEPAPPAAYAAAMIDAATRDHGYRWVGAAHLADDPSLAAVLLVSNDRSTFALVHDGLRRREHVAYTILTSVRADTARTMETSDVPIVGLDPSIDVETLLNADFGELVRMHADRRKGPVDALPDDVGWPWVNDLARASTERTIARGRARRVGADRFRYTLRAVVRLTLGEWIRQWFNPPPFNRVYKRRPGSDAVPTTTTVANAAPE